MIDLHCHILPHCDDGAEDTETAVMMAELSTESGVRMLAATPHCNLPNTDRKNYISDHLARQYLALQRELKRRKIPLQLITGAEVFCRDNVPKLLRKGLLPMIADSRFMLLEFDFPTSIEKMDRLLAQIAAEGVAPMIAHPERYYAVQEDPEIAKSWVRRGYVLQINKDSVMGTLGRAEYQTARYLIGRRLAHCVASDAHSADLRTPGLRGVYENLEEIFPDGYAELLLKKNPYAIVQDTMPVRP